MASEVIEVFYNPPTTLLDLINERSGHRVIGIPTDNPDNSVNLLGISRDEDQDPTARRLGSLPTRRYPAPGEYTISYPDFAGSLVLFVHPTHAVLYTNPAEEVLIRERQREDTTDIPTPDLVPNTGEYKRREVITEDVIVPVFGDLINDGSHVNLQVYAELSFRRDIGQRDDQIPPLLSGSINTTSAQ